MATIKLRLNARTDTAENLRPPPPDPGGGGDPVAGRLGRPKMVELWRSQGGGGIPTPTTPDRWVDPTNGSDGNNGLSAGSAWRTMGHAMNQTSGLGVAVGYLSGVVTANVDVNGQGSGTNFVNRVNTHYVLEGHEVVFRNDWRFTDAIKIQNVSYFQIAGFEIDNTNRIAGGNTAEGRYGIQIQDYQGLNTCHHIIIADCKASGMSSAGIATYGARYVRMLGCEIYDCGWYANNGGSGSTFNNADRPFDSTPAGYINGQPIDIWVQGCYWSGCRQKVDSRFINDGNGPMINDISDGNAVAVDFWKYGSQQHEPIRSAFINCIMHNTGGRSANNFDAAKDYYVINCLGAYGGRHLEYVNTPGDPVQGMNPFSLQEFLIQDYTGRDRPTGHYWNNVAVAGSWMGGSAAYQAYNADISASNNVRTAGYGDGSHSSQIGDPGFVVDSFDGSTFDPRPASGSSPLLSGGNGALLLRCTDDQGNVVNTDFAGNPVTSSSTHVGPYAAVA